MAAKARAGEEALAARMVELERRLAALEAAKSAAALENDGADAAQDQPPASSL
jgi:BMFP domain-containing protein YqiC